METTKDEFLREFRRGSGENIASKWEKERLLAEIKRKDSILRKVRTQVIAPREICVIYELVPVLGEPVTISMRSGESMAWSRIPPPKFKRKAEKPVTKKEKKAAEKKVLQELERKNAQASAVGGSKKKRKKGKQTRPWGGWYADNDPEIANLPESRSSKKKAWSPLIYTAGFENSRKRH